MSNYEITRNLRNHLVNECLIDPDYNDDYKYGGALGTMSLIMSCILTDLEIEYPAAYIKVLNIIEKSMK